MKEVAIFGGTFNPPTLAHEAAIEACLDRPSLDEVWLMLSGERWDKPEMLDDQVRLRMLELVKKFSFSDDPRIKISTFELDLPRPTQTYKTAKALEAAYPDHFFWYVIGADTYSSMPTWENGEQLRESQNFLLIPRLGDDLPPVDEHLRHLEEFDVMVHGISSTEVRRRVAAGQSIRHLVSPAIIQCIKEEQLYRPLPLLH